MSEHRATIEWQRAGANFLQGKYSREHTWSFDGGMSLSASASPAVVPHPYSHPAFIDPEEAFVAAVSSCHMLTFLHLASKRGFQVDRYRDAAVGQMSPNEQGVPWVSRITLHPQIDYGGDKRPSASDEDLLHHQAHEQCFIANSVKTRIDVGGAAPAESIHQD